jgi:hypothetical protein
MLRWLRARFRRPPEPQDPEPLPGLAGEAVLLLAAYEGMGGGTPAEILIASRMIGGYLPQASLARTEAELDAAERDRWMGDAHGWANRAMRGVLDGDDPYRETPRPDEPLREAGARVRQAIRADSLDHVAHALADYVALVRNRS